MAKDPYRYFRVEARELGDQLGSGVLDLERGGADSGQVARLLRLAHTLKGAARVVKQREIADIAHAIEDELAPYREGNGPVPRPSIDMLLNMVDGIQEQLKALSPPPAAEKGPAISEEMLGVIRPDMVEMDALLRSAAETRSSMTALRENLGVLKDLRQRIAFLAELRSVQPGARTAVGGVKSLAADLHALFGSFERKLVAAAERTDQELRQLCDAAERLRLVPATALFNTLERTARDVAGALGNDIVFEGRDGGVRLEAPVLAIVQGAFVQLVRNAVAHGIEPKAARIAAGKPPAGRVIAEVTRRGRSIVFSCTDDGSGVDIAAVRRVAQDKGLDASRINGHDAGELLQFLLRGGISTSGTVTELSGRGIGLDIVREAAERLQGEVTVRTAAGRGTTMELVIPMPVAALPALLVEYGESRATIPLDAVKRISRIARGEVARAAQGETVVYQDAAVPFARLSELLGGPHIGGGNERRRHSRPIPVLFVASVDGIAAIGVDRLRGIVNRVMKPLPAFMPDIALVAGSSLDATGDPQVMLHPDALVAAAGGYAAPREKRAPPAPTVMVVDDSLTTRMLEQSILETAGYRVHAAQSGEEAFAEARRKRFGLFLVDVEMPGMDGFTFIEKLRADARLRDIPAILVTSRASPEDRRRGEEVGAQGYIVKSEFDQAAFLDHIRQMVRS